MREQAPEQMMKLAPEQAPQQAEDPAVQHEEQQIVQPMILELPEVPKEEEKSAEVEIPSLDDTQAQILLSVMRGEPVAGMIREKALMPSVVTDAVTDAINEALFDEIGDNVLMCEGDEITLVEDYREDLERILE